MLGNYNPATYQATTILNHPNIISQGIHAEVSSDSLKKYIIALAAFGNRNSGSDTISSTFGIGAARRWVFQNFLNFHRLMKIDYFHLTCNLIVKFVQ